MPAIQGEILLSLLRDHRVRGLWTVGLLSGVARWLDVLVAGIYAVEVTGSPLLVALLIVLRMAPFVLVGPLIGAVADRLPPRLLFVAGLVGATVTSATVVVFFLTGNGAYWVVAAASFLSGVIWTTDMPLRRRLLGDVAGSTRLATAIGIDTAVANGTRMLGPLMGGALYQWLGVGGAYALSALLFGIAALLLLGITGLSDVGAGSSRAERILRQLREAIVVALRDRDIRAILAVTVIFNIWGFPFMSMIPVIGADELGLQAAWIGVLAALDGAGALVGALLVALLARPSLFRAIYVGGTASYLIAAFVVGSLDETGAVAVAILVVGLASACFGTMQSTLIYAVSPPAMRGRMFGLLVLAIGSGLIGFANIGLMGEWFGAAAAVKIVAAEGDDTAAGGDRHVVPPPSPQIPLTRKDRRARPS